MIPGKVNILCVLKILEEYSDADHILPMRELIYKIQMAYGIKLDRRAIYSSIALLTEFGYDISDYEDNHKGYCLMTRTFEESEARILMDSILRSPFISAKRSSKLIVKIQSQLSSYQQKKHRHLIVAKPSIKTLGDEVFGNINILGEAIDSMNKVEFIYLSYDFDKEMKPRRKEKYIVNPYGLVCANGQYYLVCLYDGYEKISHYRIDRIKSISILDEKATPAPKNFDIHNYIDRAIYMFGGTPELITIVCGNEILNDVIDKFGMQTRLSQNNDGTFNASFLAAPKGVIFWALQYLPHCEITEPKWARDEIIEIIRSSRYMSKAIDSE